MERKKASDFDQDLLNLFDKYVHGAIDRRGFLDGASRFAVGGITAAMLLDSLSPNFAAAQVISPEDKRITTERIDVPSPQGSGSIRGYMCRPAAASGRLPGIIVIHENRGLNPHIEDIARRLALDNFVAFAPDALTALGGYPGNEDDARALFGKLDQTKIREDFVAATNFLKGHASCTGRVGAVGFCYGGGMSYLLAARVPDLAAAVPFYGNSLAPAEAAQIKAPLLVHHAENDERINAAWPEFAAALTAAKVPHERYLYPGTQHGFNNDTTPRFDEAAAKLAWERTLAFFNRHVRG